MLTQAYCTIEQYLSDRPSGGRQNREHEIPWLTVAPQPHVRAHWTDIFEGPPLSVHMGSSFPPYRGISPCSPVTSLSLSLLEDSAVTPGERTGSRRRWRPSSNRAGRVFIAKLRGWMGFDADPAILCVLEDLV
ncbi:hypothetical protein AXF42_Ash015407 [Apostasia shenzhenica]|uniref:Uncharacterized protein n=1 Tax=Apostasia shenzhenica TaxID=1088818 RepID=A0A2H9ZS44_9ASPA|nr:hypothetical protein AXF42_Ash015407 [Apostasia shenzhenica]